MWTGSSSGGPHRRPYALTFAEGTLTAIFRKPFDLLTEWPDDPNEYGADPDEQNRRRNVWSGWVYAYRTFWLDPGADWDEPKVAEFLEGTPCGVAF